MPESSNGEGILALTLSLVPFGFLAFIVLALKALGGQMH